MNGLKVNKKVKVTILMPVYNGEKYLREAIESILNQTYKDLEFLIINDGSTDKSRDIINEYKDHRIIYIENEKNIGLARTLNKGLEISNGEYIARMDQDDISLPLRLAKQLFFMENHPDVGVCGSWIKVFGKKIKSGVYKYEIDPEIIRCQLLFINPLAHPSVILRKKFFIENKLFYNDRFENAEDYELWTRAIKYFKISNIGQLLLKYRISENQMCQQNQAKQNMVVMQIKKNVIKDLDIELTEDEIMQHQLLGAYNTPLTKEFVIKSLDWLLKIKTINEQKLFYSQTALTKTLGQVFYFLLIKNLILGPWVLKIFWQSVLNQGLTVRQKIRFTIKFFINNLGYILKFIKKNFNYAAKNIK